MAITGGFGSQIDLERGTCRRWYMGRDGVKRWVDDDAEIATSMRPEAPPRDALDEAAPR